jgi:YihY family inner membrane protein
MNVIQKTINTIDNFQRRHRFPGFVYAVIKKYGDDDTGYQAALLTYYGFLSLFPLLLVITTLTSAVTDSHSELQKAVTDGVTDYFPVLGNQLSSHVTTLHQSGPALIVGILLTLYGARGVADAFRRGINHVWATPRDKLEGFPKAPLKSLAIILIGGLGLLLASVVAGVAAAAGHGIEFRALSLCLNFIVLFGLFLFLIKFSLPNHVAVKDIRLGAITAAVGLLVLQTFGGYILTRELKNLDALYSYFALSLGLLFWIYLQAQVLYYSAQIAIVHSQKLWPRSLTGEPTAADKKLDKRIPKVA